MEQKRKPRKFNQAKRSRVGIVLAVLTVLVIAALIYVNV
jgi:hypothetical protein